MYERALNDYFSAGAGFTYSPNYAWGSGINFWETVLSARFYPAHTLEWIPDWDKGLRGLFAGLLVGYQGASINYSYSDRRGSYSVTGSYPPAPLAGFEFGSKVVFGLDSGFYLEPRIGLEIPFGAWNTQTSATGDYTNGTGFQSLYGMARPRRWPSCAGWRASPR